MLKRPEQIESDKEGSAAALPVLENQDIGDALIERPAQLVENVHLTTEQFELDQAEVLRLYFEFADELKELLARERRDFADDS